MPKQPVPTTPKRDSNNGQYKEQMPRPQPLVEQPKQESK